MILDCETYPFSSGNAAPRIVAVVDDYGIRHRDVYPVDMLRNGFVGFGVEYDAACFVSTYGDEARRAIFSAYDKGAVREVRLSLRLEDFAKMGDAWGKYDLVSAHTRKTEGPPHAESGQKKGDGWRLRYGELDGVPVGQWPAEAAAYMREDYRCTAELAAAVPVQVDEREQARYHFALRLMSAWGVRPEPSRLAAYAEGLAVAVAATEPPLRDAGLVRPSGTRDMGAIRGRVVDAYAGRELPETKGGAPSTAAEVLESSGDPLLEILALYQSAKASQDRELSLMQGSPNGVHTRYDLQVTGRTSSSGPNLQNLRRGGIDFSAYSFINRDDKVPGSRSVFAPRPGYAWLTFDYPALEMRCWAQVLIALGCGDGLARAFNEGIDAHTELAADIAGCSYSEAIERRKTDPAFDNLRQTAKAANFGFMGGMGARAFVDYAWSLYRVKLTFARAKQLQAAWNRRRREFRRYADIVSAYLREKDGTIEHYRSGRVRARCSFPAACNTLFQGLGGDVTKDTIWQITKECFSDHGALLGSHPCLFVHDELLIETPLELLDLHAKALHDIVQDVWSHWIPDVALGDLGIAATDVWSKAARRIVDDNGRLVVYTEAA